MAPKVKHIGYIIKWFKYIKNIQSNIEKMRSKMAIFCFLFGSFLVAQQLEIWNMWRKNSFIDLLATHGKDQQVFAGMFLMILGFSVLIGNILSRGTKKTTLLLSSIKAVTKAYEIEKITSEEKERYMKSILGITIFEDFLYWLADEKILEAKFAAELVKRWQDYLENRPQ